MASEAKLLTVQFLQWVAARPRRYAEVRDAWSSTCPLNCAWEDAICDDLVRADADGLCRADRSAAAPGSNGADPPLPLRRSLLDRDAAEYRTGPPPCQPPSPDRSIGESP